MSIYHTDTMTYLRRTPERSEIVELPIYAEDGSVVHTAMVIYVQLLQSGVKTFPCRFGSSRKLPDEERLKVMQFVKRHRSAMSAGTNKTYAGWQNTGLDIQDYLHIGDMVDDDLVDYFRNIMTPLINRYDLFQVAEPFAHVPNDDPTSNGDPIAVPAYVTFQRFRSARWQYAGICRLDSFVNAYNYVSTLDKAIAELGAEMEQ